MDYKRMKRIILQKSGIKQPRSLIIQIELAGKCTANCEFCDWTRRPKEQMIFMDTTLAKKAVKEAKEMGAAHISFHVTGESLDHPDLFDIMPKDWNIGLSTNCLSLIGDKAIKLACMTNLNLILAILWAESKEKRERSLENAIKFLNINPKCKSISVQMICSEHSIPHAKFMYENFSRYFDKLPQLKLFYKQPYTQEKEYPTLGYIPEGVVEGKRIGIDKMPTPQSCGDDCMAVPPNPMTSILIQVDGEIKPCFYRPNDPLKINDSPKEFYNGWGMGNIRETTLQEFWNSDKLKKIREIWATGDPDKKLPCHNCIRMAVPRGDPKWWNTTGIIPTRLDCNQALKGDITDPYPKPDNR